MPSAKPCFPYEFSTADNFSMTLDCPSVSICVPVYNGENYLRQAIDSILDQTHKDFELIISDNASTDRTSEICREALARDRRVRYFRAPVNGGLAWNFNHAFHLARGNYLVWLGHDDLMGKEYLARCVDALNGDSAAVLSYTNSNYIDHKGEVIKKVEPDNPGSFKNASRRFRAVLYDWMCDPICGVMKTQVLRQTRLFGVYADNDRVLLAEMALRGRFRLVPEYLFSRRQHAGQSTLLYRNLRDRTVFYDTSKKGRLLFPVALEVIGLFSAIHRAKLTLGERADASRFLLRWLWYHRGANFRDEVREGVLFIIKRCLSEEQLRVLKSVKRRCLRTGAAAFPDSVKDGRSL